MQVSCNKCILSSIGPIAQNEYETWGKFAFEKNFGKIRISQTYEAAQQLVIKFVSVTRH